MLAYRGYKIAAQAPDVFGALLAAGATSWLVFEAAFNIAAMTGLVPFTGIPLPFISYGGSALVSAMGAVGILLSVSRGTREARRGKAVRLLISGGGTGGHVYPALAVVEALRADHRDRQSRETADAICWIGSEGGVEQELVARAGLPFEAIPAGGLHGLAPWVVARNILRLARGFAAGRGTRGRMEAGSVVCHRRICERARGVGMLAAASADSGLPAGY